MKTIRTIILAALLLCAAGAYADEAGERMFIEAMEHFERLHGLMFEVAERGGVKEGEPLARELEEQYRALEEHLRRKLQAHADEFGPHIKRELERFKALIEEFGDRHGAVAREHIEETGEIFHHLMEAVAEALGVHQRPHEEPGFFDVTVRLEFAVEGGGTILVSTATPHYRVAVEARKNSNEESEEASSRSQTLRHFACEGELHSVGERWFLHCAGEFRLAEEAREVSHGESETESETETEVSFDASVLLRPGQTVVLAGPAEHPLRVTLHLED